MHYWNYQDIMHQQPQQYDCKVRMMLSRLQEPINEYVFFFFILKKYFNYYCDTALKNRYLNKYGISHITCNIKYLDDVFLGCLKIK
ncbi:hypothetical protein NUSPORA_00820 [Nucleospora cyclopteri]